MMWDFPYDSEKALAALLETEGLAMTKNFGQNFLISASARRKIVEAIAVGPADRVWEIGPGLGSLTADVLRTGASVTAFEIDHGFCRILREQAFSGHAAFTLIEGDFLKTWEGEFSRNGVPEVICGNLPYNVGSICIARLIEGGCVPHRMVFTLQKEVAERLAATVGSKSWSTLSILTQLDYRVGKLFSIGPGSFFPPPNVESAVVLLSKREVPQVDEGLRKSFLRLVDDIFTQRRKTVRNNLLGGDTGQRYGKQLVLQALSLAEIEESERCEQLGIDRIKQLAAVIERISLSRP